jgi:hypothetical protein
MKLGKNLLCKPAISDGQGLIAKEKLRTSARPQQVQKERAVRGP